MKKHFRFVMAIMAPTIALLLSAFPSIAQAAEFLGKVVEVVDGDTIKVMHEGKAVKILLAGIDCPEIKQPFGEKAKEYTYGLAFGQVVTVKEKAKSQYGRIVAEIVLPEKINLNRQLVWAGLAWWYRKRAPDNSTLAEAETRAKKARRGLWTDESPIPPWEWRKSKRQDQTKSKPEKVKIVYRGNTRSKDFHRPGCRYYDCRACTVILETRVEAINLGYKPCKLCKP